MNEKPEIKVGKLPIITKFIYTLGVLPTSYLMSMTYQEQVTWLYNYLQTKVIPTIDGNAEAVKELQTLFELLRTYVNSYFDNLDVQEEINNKLDEMVEDGTLQEIVASYLETKALFCFDTLEDMKQATNLINGSYARTLGYYEINDGGGATYKITDGESETEYQEVLESGLFASLIIENEIDLKQIGSIKNNYIDNIFDIALGLSNIINISDEYKFQSNHRLKNNITINFNTSKIISESLTLFDINNCENIIINGNNCVFDLNETGNQLFYCDIDHTCKNIILKDFSVINREQLPSYNAPIRIYGCNNGLIENINVKDYGYSAYNYVTGQLCYDILVMNSSFVTIRNCNLEHGSIAIYTSGSNNLLIDNIKAKNFSSDGIYIRNGSNNIILSNCLIDNTKQGIAAYGNNIKLLNNSIFNCSLVGIFLRVMNNSIINNNYINNCNYSIQDMLYSDLEQEGVSNDTITISNCIFENATNSSDGILLRSSKNIIFDNCKFIENSSKASSILLSGYAQYIDITNSFFNNKYETPINTAIHMTTYGAYNNCHNFKNNKFINYQYGFNSYIPSSNLNASAGNYISCANNSGYNLEGMTTGNGISNRFTISNNNLFTIE